LGKIGEAPNLLGPICRTARQHLEVGEISGPRAFRFQVIAKKPGMTDLVVGIVMNVLRHVPIEELQRL